MKLFNPFRSPKPPQHAAAPAAAPMALEAAAPLPELSAEARARLDQLFRLGPRAGTINPLLYVLVRYRTEQAAKE